MCSWWARFSASVLSVIFAEWKGISCELTCGLGMYHSGIGGGGFMLVRGSNGSYEFIDFRETAPAAAFQDMFKDDPVLSIYGGLAR